jgi:hypothetical protein
VIGIEKENKIGTEKENTVAQGIPLAATMTAANVNEVTQVFRVLTDLAPVGGKPGPKQEKPERLQGDRRCWPNGIRSTGAAWRHSAGSSSGRSPGCIHSAGCGAAWTGSRRFKEAETCCP